MTLNDPILWICAGILLFGAVFLIWAISKLRRPKSTEEEGDVLAQGVSAEYTDMDMSLDAIEGSSLNIPTLVTPPFRSAPAPAPVSKDIADRLEGMTQRLAEMQAVLSKQASVPTATVSTSAGSSGPGFSPETIDKLLKIIGNVIQQVDILQRSLNISRPEGFPAGTTPAAAPKPAAAGTSIPPLGTRPFSASPMGSLSAVKPGAPAPGTGPASKPPTGPANS